MSMIWVVNSEQGWRKGPWTPEEDKLLIEYVTQHGEGRWSCVSKLSGLKRSGKSCRLRWVNYLRPGLKKGNITPQEEGIIIELHALWGNKWSTIARYLPGRTDNEIKNYWRTHFKKRSKPSPPKQHAAAVHHNRKQNQEDGGDKKFSNIEDGGVSDRRGDSSGKQEMGPNDSTDYNNHHQFVPAMFYYSNQDVYGGGYNDSLSSDFIMVDSNLWGGLWN